MRTTKLRVLLEEDLAEHVETVRRFLRWRHGDLYRNARNRRRLTRWHAGAKGTRNSIRQIRALRIAITALRLCERGDSYNPVGQAVDAGWSVLAYRESGGIPLPWEEAAAEARASEGDGWMRRHGGD